MGKNSSTRMHSSRMRTARSSSRRGGDVCLSACWDTPLWVWLGDSPQVWAWRPPTLQCGPGDPPWGRPLNFPPGCGPGDPPPQARPLNFPTGCGLETCKACWDTNPLETCCKACWDTTYNACWDTTPPLNRITDTCKNITLPQLRCGR